MKKSFDTIIIVGRFRSHQTEIIETILHLYKFLKKKKLDAFIDEDTASLLPDFKGEVLDSKNLNQCDLIIAVGGDGSMLHASQIAVAHNTPILGINKGRLGFLTDIKPSEIETELNKILDNQHTMEQRFLLNACIELEDGSTLHDLSALNDIVLLPGEISPHMIEFSISINDELVYKQRADGLIVATPTGSTAYALSGGGPILHPNLDAIVLVPMFPHTLSNRPIVINNDNVLRIHIEKNNTFSPHISCDGQRKVNIEPNQSIIITKKVEKLTLIHPLTYDYYETLRSKLRWQIKT